MAYDLTILGWMQEHELQVLEQLAKTVPENGVVVEVGSFMGRTSYMWSKTVPESATVYCVDKFPDNWPLNKAKKYELINSLNGLTSENKQDEYNIGPMFDVNTASCRNIIKVQGVSPYDIKYSGGLIDLLFVDCAHVNPIDFDNLHYFLQFMNIETGIISGHDYYKDYPDVIHNVHYFSKLLNRPFKIYNDTSIWSINMKT